MDTLTVEAPAGRLTGTLRRGVWRCHTVAYATAAPFAPARRAAPADHDGRRPGAGELTLTLTAPHPAPAGAPVLVWIHGGRYEEGHPSEPWTNARLLAARGVIGVSLGYRKRLDGFWRDREADPLPAVADLLHALDWVRDNAPALGGDPDRVTLAGQSAGAGLALTLAARPEAAGRVARVLAASPGFSHRSGGPVQRAAAAALLRGPATRARLARLHAESGPAAVAALYARLRRLSPTEPALGPHAAEGRPGLPLMVTATSEEFHFLPELRRVDARRGARAIARATALAHGGRGRLPADPAPMSRVISDATIRRYAVGAADAAVAAGVPVWAAEFRPGAGVGTGPAGPTSGAPHCIELPRLFGREQHPFHEAALAFIVAGDPAAAAPGVPGDPGWPSYADPGRPARVYAGAGPACAASVTADPWAEVRALFPPPRPRRP